MIPAMRERRRYRDRSHGFGCCSHPTVSIDGRFVPPDGRVLIQNTGCRRLGLSSIHVPRAGRRAGRRTDPSTGDGVRDNLPGADLRPSGNHVSEKYLAFDGERCYYDSQPEPPLFTVFLDNLTINDNGDSGYFFMLLTGHK